MSQIKEIVEQSDTKWGRVFALTVQFLIALSMVTFSIETLPNLSDQVKTVLWTVELVTVGLFTVEYLLRVYVADHRLRFVTSFFGIVDLLAILPFYLSLGIDLRSIRAFRLLRLFRIFKLARYSRAVRTVSSCVEDRSRRIGSVWLCCVDRDLLGGSWHLLF